jgi:hypothetical protein
MKKFVVIDEDGNRVSKPLSEAEAKEARQQALNECANSKTFSVKEILNG